MGRKRVLVGAIRVAMGVRVEYGSEVGPEAINGAGLGS